MHEDAILKSLKGLAARAKLALSAVGSAMDPELFGEIPEWRENTTLLIWGKAGTGKSTLAKMLLPTALFISHPDKLKDFDATMHGGIIFDDMSFKHWPRTTQIHLVDIENDRQIHIRYKVAEIPAGTKKIITTNEFPENILFYNDEAIKRRITVWKMDVRNNILLEN